MTAATFEELKNRLDALKSRHDKAQGTQDAIKKRWMEELGTDDPDKVRELVTTEEKNLAELEREYTELMGKAEAIISRAEAV